ncbi:MAG: ATP-binding protein [Sandaracinaceae bacterium]
MAAPPERSSSSASLLSRVLEVMPGGIVTVTADGTFLTANAQAQSFLGLSWDELGDRYVADFAADTYYEDGRPCPVEDYPVSRCIGTGQAQPPMTLGVRQPNGELRWAIFTALPLEPGNGGAGAVVTFVDITERRREEVRWRAQTRLVDRVQVVRLRDRAGDENNAFEEPLAALLELTDSTCGFVVRLDRGAPADREACLEVRIDRAEPEHVPTSTRLALSALSQRAVRGGVPLVVEAPGVLGGGFGGHRASRVALFPLRAGDERVGIVGLASAPSYDARALESLAPLLQGCADLIRAFDERDERDRLRAQLAQTERLASVGTLAAGMAHEVNNPLSYVLLNLEAVVRQSREITEVIGTLGLPDDDGTAALLGPEGLLASLAQRGRDASEGAERVRNIVRDLMAFARVTEEEVGPVDVNGTLKVALKMANHEIKYRARLVCDLGELPSTQGHDGRLSQVFLNLLLNAARAIQEGDPEQNEVKVETFHRDAHIHIVVADTGRGIDPAHLPRLFEPFFSTRAEGSGSGLGLSICHKVVKDHGGRILVESAPDQGCRFEVVLPVVRARRSSAPPPVRPSAPAAGDGVRMLLVDDEPMVRRILAQVLGQNFEVEVAEGREEACQRLAEESFDVVLCDMMMLDGTGVDVHAWVTEHRPDMAARMLFMTGGTFTPRARAFLAAEGRPHLKKPFTLDQVERAVRSLLRVP